MRSLLGQTTTAALWKGAQVASRLRTRSATLLPIVALMAAGLTLAGGETPGEGGETLYLTLLATLALVGTSLVAPVPATETDWGALVAAALLWLIPAGPERGAMLTVALLAIAAIAIRRRITPSVDLGLETWLGLALLVQTFARGDLLLPRAISILDVARFALPALLAAAAGAALVRLRSPTVALLTIAATATVGPGFTATSTLPLLGVVAGLLLVDHRGRRRRRLGLLSVAVLAAVTIVRPGPAVLALLVVAVVTLPAWLAGTATTAAVLLALAFADGAISHLLWLPLVLPACLLVRPSPLTGLRRRSPLVVFITAAALALVGVLIVDTPAGLAAALVLLAAALELEPPRLGIQALWSALLLAGVSLLTAYPWLRVTPIAELLDLFADGPAPLALLFAVGAFVAATAGPWRLGRVELRGPVVLAALVVVVAWHALPRQSAVLTTGEGVRLTDRSATWTGELPRIPVGSIVVDSSLANAAGLADGTEVATVSVLRGESVLVRIPVVAGRHTGEWAALRGTGAGRLPSAAWMHWVPAERSFFARRYRGRLELDEIRRGATHVRITRRPELPSAVVVAVERVEVRG